MLRSKLKIFLVIFIIFFSYLKLGVYQIYDHVIFIRLFFKFERRVVIIASSAPIVNECKKTSISTNMVIRFYEGAQRIQITSLKVLRAPTSETKIYMMMMTHNRTIAIFLLFSMIVVIMVMMMIVVSFYGNEPTTVFGGHYKIRHPAVVVTRL